MNLRQEKFIDEYLIDFNAARAAVSAGYGTKNARSQGWRLLADPAIQAELTKRRTALAEGIKLTQERVIQELAALGFSNIFDFVEIKDGREIRLKENIPNERQKALVNIKAGKFGLEVKLYDKIRALELLGKYTGLFDNLPNQPETENNLFAALDATGEYLDCNNIPETQDEPE